MKPREFWLSLYVSGVGVVHNTASHAKLTATGDEIVHVREVVPGTVTIQETEIARAVTALRACGRLDNNEAYLAREMADRLERHLSREEGVR